MKDGPDISITAALIGDPARANMVMALMSGSSLTMGELAAEAGVTLSTASVHLAKLESSRIVVSRKQGRSRHFRIADPDVAHCIEALVTVAARDYIAQRYPPAVIPLRTPDPRAPSCRRTYQPRKRGHAAAAGIAGPPRRRCLTPFPCLNRHSCTLGTGAGAIAHGGHFTQSRNQSSSPDDAYKALTTLEGLSGWWTNDTQGESKVGGVIQFRFGAGGFDMKVLELHPNKRVLWQVVDGPAEWIGTKVSFDLKQEGDWTIILFKHQGWKEPV